MPKFTLCLLFCSGVFSCAAAQTAATGSGWDHLKALPAGIRMHVRGDKLTRTCTLDRVTDDELVCSKGRVVDTAHYTFTRAEVESVKLTRYTLSTVAGFGIGAAAGGAISAAAIKSDSFKGAAVGILAGGAAIVGALITGPTDAFRGPTVYRRVKP